MKKIIYSLVIMIAAGSLFTSCVENTEPQGIKDLRLAKADYLDALSNLRAADAEKVKAEATLVQAKAAVQQAVAAKEQAAAKFAEAQAKAQEITNDKTAAENAIALEKAKAEAEVYLVNQENLLAQAEEALRKQLIEIEEQSKKLTDKEQTIVGEYTTAYKKVVEKQAEVRRADSLIYVATYNSNGENTVEAAKAKEKRNIAIATADIERAQAKYEEYAKKSEEEIAKYDVWAEEVKKLEDSSYSYNYVLADIEKAEALAKIEYDEAFVAFYKEINTAKAAVQKAVTAAGNGFSLDKSYTLPTTGKSVVETFAKYVNTAGFSEAASFKVEGGKLVVKATDKDATAKNIFGDEKNPDNASLAGIIDALKRDSIVVDKIINDTTGLSAAVAKVKAEYAAVKDTLEKGVAAYEPIAKAQAKVDSLEKVVNDVDSLFRNDTVALIKAFKDFVEVWNEHADENPIDKNDSLEIWNAFKAVVVARDKALAYDAKGGKRFFYYYHYVIDPVSGASKKVKDSVDFKDLEYAGIKKDGNGNALYGVGEGEVQRDAFYAILNGAFGCNYVANKWGTAEGGKITTSEITWEELIGHTNYLENALFGKYWVNTPADGKIYITNGGGKVYESEAVVKAKEDKANAGKGIPAAKENFYENIYCKFWGLTPSKTSPGSDSLKINYSEKTYTDPYVIPVFSAKDEGAPIFTPAKGQKAADFVWDNLTYNNDDTELKLIKEKLGQDNIWIENGKTFTLYAKSLAVEQIAGLVEDYKENTKALAALEKVVASVEEYYDTTLLKIAGANAVADSAVIAYLGEDIVKTALKNTKKTAKDLWKDADLVVDCANRNIDDFCEEGEYTFGGLQLAAAEKWIPDYAASQYLIKVTIDGIEDIQDNCKALAKIVKDYAQRIADLDDYNVKHKDNPIKIEEKVIAYWKEYLAEIKTKIDTAETAKATAEGNLAKLEAGYDTTQLDIQSAEEDLAKAKQALEQAEVEFGIAEEAYKAVLANHGIAE